MSGLKPGFNFNFEWRITLFALLLIPFMAGLGLWQLQRAEEKAELASAFEERRQQPSAPLSLLWGKSEELLAYSSVRMVGKFLPDQYFLLDNQVRDGRVGYEVLGILQLADDAGSVLVNRGWIVGDAARRSLPVVPVVEGAVELTGHVYVAPGEPYLLAEQRLDMPWPKRIQAVEMDKLVPAVTGLLGGRVFPFPVRIDAGESGALAVNWQVVNMSPEKHQAYAAQWLAMAAVLFLLYLFSSSNLWQLISCARRAGK